MGEQLEVYQELAKGDKKIDLSALALAALQNQNSNLVSPKEKKWAYLISVGAPPLGLLFAVKLYLSAKDDGRHVAKICIVLTIISLLSIWLVGKMFFSSSGVDTKKIQQLKSTDINELLN